MIETATAVSPKKQTNYRFGVYAEHRTKSALRDLGFTVVRAASSHGPADIIAIRKDVLLLVQVKRGAKCPSPNEWQTLESMAVPFGAIKATVFYPTDKAAMSGTTPRVLWCDPSGWGEDYLRDLFRSAGWTDCRAGWPKQTKLRGI